MTTPQAKSIFPSSRKSSPSAPVVGWNAGHRAQCHILTFLGTDWCEGQRPQWPDDKIVAITRQIVAKGGVVTYDVPIQKNGLIRPAFVEQLRAVGRSMTEKATFQADAPRACQIFGGRCRLDGR